MFNQKYAVKLDKYIPALPFRDGSQLFMISYNLISNFANVSLIFPSD